MFTERNFLLVANLNLPSFSSKPFALVLSLQALVGGSMESPYHESGPCSYSLKSHYCPHKEKCY